MMLNLLARLTSVELRLLAPALPSAAGAFGGFSVEPLAHARLLHEIKQLRLRDGKCFSVLPTTLCSMKPDTRDADSWHVVAVERSSGEVVGAIRLRLYSAHDSAPEGDDLFAYSDIAISDEAARSTIHRALSDYVARQLSLCQHFYIIGGFIVAQRYRQSALAAVLALSVNTWVARLNLHGGCTFVTIESGHCALDQRFGAFPLADERGELGSFFCEAHQTQVKTLVTEPQHYEPRLGATVSALEEHMRGCTVLLPAESFTPQIATFV
jgi:hypothetical protein